MLWQNLWLSAKLNVLRSSRQAVCNRWPCFSRRGLRDGGKESAAYALGNIAAHSEERSAQIVKAGALQPLVSLLKEGSDCGKEWAANALGHLAANSEEWSAFVKTGALQPIVAILNEGSCSAKDAAMLLVLLGKHEAMRVRIVSAGILQPLAKLVREGPVDLQDVADRALMILSGSREEYTAQIELVSGLLNESMLG